MNWNRVICIRVAVPDNVDMEAVAGQIMSTVCEEAPTTDGTPPVELNANWCTMGEPTFSDWLWKDMP